MQCKYGDLKVNKGHHHQVIPPHTLMWGDYLTTSAFLTYKQKHEKRAAWADQIHGISVRHLAIYYIHVPGALA